MNATDLKTKSSEHGKGYDVNICMSRGWRWREVIFWPLKVHGYVISIVPPDFIMLTKMLSKVPKYSPTLGSFTPRPTCHTIQNLFWHV